MSPFTAEQIIGVVSFVIATPAFIKMCWNVAEFAISARKDISTLTKSVEKLEKNLNEGMATLAKRLDTLEKKDAVREAIEHVHEETADGV